ncbi:MAG: GspE/PulE family protein [Candidatus Methylomirabilia bacterium]
MGQVDTVQTLRAKVAYEQKLVRVTNRIHGADSLDSIFIALRDEILALLDADRVTLYAIDLEKNELYSKFLELDSVKEIRVPLTEKSVAAYAALTRATVNISDAYNKAELAGVSPALTFDSSWDQKTGYRTRQVLVVPILKDDKNLVGVIQLLNKNSGPQFTRDDITSVERIAKTLGIAFHNQYRLAQQRPTKFDHLLSQHLITQEELNVAIATARQKQTDVESILIEQYRVPKTEIGMSLSQFYKCPFVEFDERLVPPADLMKGLKLEFLKQNCWVPLRHQGGGVVVLIDNPRDLQKVDSIERLLPNQKIQFAVGFRTDIRLFLSAATGDQVAKDSISTIIGDLNVEAATDEAEEAGDGELDENDSTVVRLVSQIITDAYRARASDIHIEPYGPQKETRIRFRVDGGCMEYQKIPGAFRRPIVARVKIISQLDIAERRKPQDGKIKFHLPEREIELRVVTVPTAGGNEDVVMRILSASEPLPIDKLAMRERNLRELKNIAEKPYGLILCVGPTGSGKTTTLHSVLGYINRPDRKIWTAEDPVEITQYGLRQVQVQPKIGFTFAMAMRSFLRADPDVIMVGEMRDAETAAIGIEASLTGHLVLSTLHTNSAVETVIRLLDMGLDPFNFADALLGVLAQRLVKQICSDCKEPYNPSREEFDALARTYGDEAFDALGLKFDETSVLYRGKGCPSCNNTGYRGRAAIHELLIATDEIKRLIQTKTRVAETLAVARQEGMTTLVQDGILKTLDGLTDFKQVKAVAIK